MRSLSKRGGELRGACASLAHALAALFTLSSARADIATTWDGATGSWANATHWSGGVFPNNVGANFYDATINGGAVSVDQAITINQLTLAGGALEGASALTALEGLQWTGGAIRGSGTLTLGNAVPSTIAGTLLFSARTINNTGAATFSAGTIRGGAGATLNNQAGATFTMLSAANFFAQVASPACTIVNAGTFTARNVAGTGFSTIDATFTNTGTLRIENTGTAHTLSLAGGGTIGGVVILAANTTLELGGTLAIPANTAFSGAGTAVVAGIATLTGGGIVAQNLVVAVGELRLAGNALAVPGNVSVLDDGALVFQLPTAGPLAIGGALSAAGTLAATLASGFTPAVGDVFDVLDFASVSGTFATLQLPALPAGRFWNTGKLYTEGKLAVGLAPSTFTQWQAAYGAGAFTADDDRDGLANGLEYLLGLVPIDGNGANGPLSAPTLTFSGAGATKRLRLQFSIADPGPTDATLRVQASDDLGLTDPWTTIATKIGQGAWSGPAVVTPGSAANGKVQVAVDDTKLSASLTKRFLRLRTEMP